MTASDFDWLILTALIIIGIAICATLGAIIESWLEWRAERLTRLRDPEWRARVSEPNKFSRWFT